MKRKINRKRIKIKQIPGPITCSMDEPQDLVDFVQNLGYIVYEDPSSNPGFLLICDKPMTYRDYYNSKLCEGSREWFMDAYEEIMDDELDTI
jgi:hypothetical protein